MGQISTQPRSIRPAGPGDLAAIREMLHEYQDWLAVDLSFQDFAREVRDLPGDYAPPGGALLIARQESAVAGMVALRRLDEGRAEMKRLYVRPAARGTGLGRELVTRILQEARARDYRAVVLDTLPQMQSAQQMYESFGFRDVPAYYQSALPGTRYMGITL